MRHKYYGSTDGLAGAVIIAEFTSLCGSVIGLIRMPFVGFIRMPLVDPKHLRAYDVNFERTLTGKTRR
jgi:hypothetical protein